MPTHWAERLLPPPGCSTSGVSTAPDKLLRRRTGEHLLDANGAAQSGAGGLTGTEAALAGRVAVVTSWCSHHKMEGSQGGSGNGGAEAGPNTCSLLELQLNWLRKWLMWLMCVMELRRSAVC